MKLPYALFVLAPVVFSFGCATSAAEDIDSGTPVDSGLKDAAKDAPKDSAKDTGPTQVCVPSCSADQDCQNSCATPPSGIYCCDIATSLCYVSSDQTCPAPSDGGSNIDP